MKEHICKHCGATTTQPDEECYKHIPAGDGLIPRIETENKYYTGDLPTLDDFKQMMETIAGGKPKEIKPVVVTPMDGIKLKIKEGYLYRIGSGKWIVHTGYGGALNYVDIARADGMSDEFIGEQILIAEDTSKPFYSLNSITWHKKNGND